MNKTNAKSNNTWNTHDHRMTMPLTSSPPDSVPGSPHDHLPLWSHRMTTQTVQPFIIKFIISNFLLTSCDLVRTASHDRGLGYSNRFDSAEFVHVPHTWS